jgi:carbon-monoxide dehydrogenase small subunit
MHAPGEENKQQCVVTHRVPSRIAGFGLVLSRGAAKDLPKHEYGRPFVSLRASPQSTIRNCPSLWSARASGSKVTASFPPERPLVSIRLSVNGVQYERAVEPRLLLSDFLRQDLGLTGTHVGCEHGVCGACTVLLDGEAVRSCLMFAVQTDGHELTTVEGLTAGDAAELHPLQAAFREAHALQCGFCTPGILLTLIPFLRDHPNPQEPEIREALSGNLCRCTGYQNIIEAVKLASGAPARR